MKKLEIFDSSLRDGAQAEGINYSLIDKLNIIQALDLLGVDYIEAGNPYASPKDREAFREAAALPLRNARLVAFGSTRRKGAAARDDEGLLAIAASGAPCAAIFGKTWRRQAADVLAVSAEENLDMIATSVAFLKANGLEVIFDAEHYFDGAEQDESYALRCLETAAKNGADRLVLCDTRGAALPGQVYARVAEAVDRFGDIVGVHLHDDIGCAAAGSIEAARAGAKQIQGTLLGFGERCGNAALATLIPTLQLKCNFETIGRKNMERLTRTARFVAAVSNVALSSRAPYVGKSAFAHKAGMHAHAVLKNPYWYEHEDPALVGNERRILMSEQSGRAAVSEKLRRVLPDATQEEAALLSDTVKRLEMQGYSFEAAEASFELRALKALGRFRPAFAVTGLKSGSDFPSEEGRSSKAEIEISVGGRTLCAQGAGDGPVHAIDKAMRSALEGEFDEIKRMKLTDYKVVVMDPGSASAARVRVMIESADGRDIWTTVGVSTDIVEASLIALCDSYEYLILRRRKDEAL